MFTPKGKHKKPAKPRLPLEATQQEIACPPGTIVACHAFHFPFSVHGSLLCPVRTFLSFPSGTFKKQPTVHRLPHLCSPCLLIEAAVWAHCLFIIIPRCAPNLVLKDTLLPPFPAPCKDFHKLLAGRASGLWINKCRSQVYTLEKKISNCLEFIKVSYL